MDITAHVMHVPGVDPQRDACVQNLYDTDDMTVCLHSDPDRNGVMWNWATVMRCMADDSATTWHLQLNDDAIPLQNWASHFRQATRNSPAPILGLIQPSSLTHAERTRQRPYLVGKFLLVGTAMAYHSSMFPGIADYAERPWTTTKDDVVAAAYAHWERDMPVALATRSVFSVHDVETLINGNRRNLPPAHTIEQPGPPWTMKPAYYTDNSVGNWKSIQRLRGSAAAVMS